METRARHLIRSAIAGGLLVSVTGCGMIGSNPAATDDEYAPADGVIVEVGDLRATNLLIVTTDADSPGRLLGSLANDADRPMTVTVETAADSARIRVPAESTILLEETTPVILDPVGRDPGLMLDTRFSTPDKSAVEPIPVLDQTFPRYAEFIPGEPPATPSGPSAGAGQPRGGGGEESTEGSR